MRTELVDVHQAAEKLRGMVWANEPVATLESSLVSFAQIRAMVDAAEIECLGVYDASKEWKATGALSAPARIAELTCGRQDSIGWRRGLARKLRLGSSAAGSLTRPPPPPPRSQPPPHR